MATVSQEVRLIRIPGDPSKFGREETGAVLLPSLLECDPSTLPHPQVPGTSTQDTVPTALPRDVTKRD